MCVAGNTGISSPTYCLTSCSSLVRALVCQPSSPGLIAGMYHSESAIKYKGNPIMLLPSTTFSWIRGSFCWRLPFMVWFLYGLNCIQFMLWRLLLCFMSSSLCGVYAAHYGIVLPCRVFVPFATCGREALGSNAFTLETYLLIPLLTEVRKNFHLCGTVLLYTLQLCRTVLLYTLDMCRTLLLYTLQLFGNVLQYSKNPAIV